MNMIEQAIEPLAPRALSRMPRGARLVMGLLGELQGGALAVELPAGDTLRVGHGRLVAHWRVRDLATFDAVLGRGDIGLGEAYMDGLWETDDLSALLGLLAHNRERLGAAVYGRFLQLAGYRLWNALRANTRRGSRRNIEAHYDLGNDFYALWLDPTMSYSAALFASADDSLEAAQRRKYRRILERLDARPGQTILEVGCGWGGFAEVAVQEFGCTVLGLTLSPAQLEFARARAQRGGFDGRASFELCDYRDVRGQYDHIVSIEMIEAVGERFWPVYFRQLAARLKPGGRCVIQAITIADALFGRYRRGTDFIQRYIFPGGMLPSPSALCTHAEAAGLQQTGDFAFGADYGRTLAHWQRNFTERLADVRAQGFSDRFIRMWRFYLAYCEAGFLAGDVDVHHFEFAHR
ncbi:SAM-dependent methyltransferase [Aromatoleum diolicum]|uniref:Methyltransferase domain-containing protein n=1 Tax=Aromatoleum diolicum TaxID=75796 RepID=A0ABX1QEX8_9RHOO|nr:cyclopropane-fatty-acyl-phospholipid synthase family protein [Aromatoleum diolicum]NMG75961.1 methyltransferase domain-containing protein [Aromatoleum diolicum]